MPNGIPEKLFLTTQEACRALGVSKKVFLQLAVENAHWCRASYRGTGKRLLKRWDRDHIICLAHIWRNTLHPAQQQDGEGAEEEEDE